MEGVIDVHTRHLLSQIPGLDWIVTEFVRVVDARLPARVFTRICPELKQGSITENGTPVTLQLLGSDPKALGQNAQQAVKCGATHLDINFGCPAKLVNRHGGGAMLLQNPEHVYTALKGITDAVDIPVSAKLRLGFNNKQLAVACAEAAVSAGADHLTVHARTKREGYQPPAHWEWVADIRRHVSIPVIVNGDIWTLEDYWKARTLSGCQDVMIGRGLLADPWLAQRIKHWVEYGERLPETRWRQRAAILIKFAEALSAEALDKVIVSLLKQWMAIMRQHNVEAHDHFLTLKRIKDLPEFLHALEKSAHSPRSS
ncbi:tRNA-dihydrouridine(16) synthase [Halomonadaceae bacterium LMG 33818]|uniref:tRNA dihydrouridine synthase n=1 Tax=Cernens ardua TaxID=3402176 RepID=UPI003EDC384D